MTKQALLDLINAVLLIKDSAPIKKLSEEDSLRTNFNFDSLDLASLTVRIEDKFGIDIFEEGTIDKIGEIINKIEGVR